MEIANVFANIRIGDGLFPLQHVSFRDCPIAACTDTRVLMEDTLKPHTSAHAAANALTDQCSNDGTNTTSGSRIWYGNEQCVDTHAIKGGREGMKRIIPFPAVKKPVLPMHFFKKISSTKAFLKIPH